jgi:hypothetical protein
MSTTARKRTSLRRTLLLVPAAVAAAALAAPAAPAAPLPSGAAPAPTTQQIIMRDGGVCDPIRHMGC